MALHKLVMDDFDDEMYVLIAIHCSLKDYRLAYILNQTLNLNLIRTKKDINFKINKSSYTLFKWYDDKKLNTWHLVSNRCKKDIIIKHHTSDLFSSNLTSSKTFYLIPEFKKADYFIKITNHTYINQKVIIDKLQKLPNIITSYVIDAEQLKSKAHLIF